MTRSDLLDRVHAAACMYAFYYQPDYRMHFGDMLSLYRMHIELAAAAYRLSERDRRRLTWGPGA